MHSRPDNLAPCIQVQHSYRNKHGGVAHCTVTRREYEQDLSDFAWLRDHDHQLIELYNIYQQAAFDNFNSHKIAGIASPVSDVFFNVCLSDKRYSRGYYNIIRTYKSDGTLMRKDYVTNEYAYYFLLRFLNVNKYINLS